MKSFTEYIKDILLKIFLKVFKGKNNSLPIEKNYCKNILITNFGSIQEILSLTPLINVIKKHLNCNITLIIDSKSKDALNNNSDIDFMILWNENFLEKLKKIIFLLKINFDVIIDSDEIVKTRYSPLITALAKVKYKIGFVGIYDKLLTHKISKAPINSVHLIDRYLKLLEPLAIDFSTSNTNIVYSPKDETKNNYEEFLIKHNMLYKFRFFLNISGKENIGCWEKDNFKRLLRYLKNYDIIVIIGTSISDFDIAKNISDGKFQIFVNDNIDQIAEVIRNSDFIFSPDSFSIQLGAAFEIPTFCLFVQHNSVEMINVPYKSDFDFVLTEKPKLNDISYGKVLNSFIPYFDYVYENYQSKQNIK